MSNEIKRFPADWSKDLGIEVIDPDGWRADGMPWSHPITEQDFRRRAAMSTMREVATPAPLDPSQKARVEIADWDDFQEFDVVVQMPGIEGGPFVVERDRPAPEPEPEWKPGTLYSATVVVDQTYDSVDLDHDVRLYRNKGIDVDYWVSPFGEVIADQHVTDVRPLVVIDPATVDVGNIIKVARDFYRFNPKADGVSPVEVGVFETLRSLGIEAP